MKQFSTSLPDQVTLIKTALNDTYAIEIEIKKKYKSNGNRSAAFSQLYVQVRGINDACNFGYKSNNSWKMTFIRSSCCSGWSSFFCTASSTNHNLKWLSLRRFWHMSESPLTQNIMYILTIMWESRATPLWRSSFMVRRHIGSLSPCAVLFIYLFVWIMTFEHLLTRVVLLDSFVDLKCFTIAML